MGTGAIRVTLAITHVVVRSDRAREGGETIGQYKEVRSGCSGI